MNSSMHGNCQDDPRECRWRWGDIKDGRRQLDGTMKLGGDKRKQMGGRGRARRHQECGERERDKVQIGRQEAVRLRCNGSEDGVGHQF